MHLLFHDEDHVSGRVEDVDQVDDARIRCAQGHEGDLVQDFRCAILAVAHLGRVFGRVLDAGGAVPTLADRREQTAAKHFLKKRLNYKQI